MIRNDIFTTPVWHIKETPLQLIDELYQGAYRFKESCPSQTRSNEGGYQTPPLDWKDFHPQGREYIKSIVNECIDRNCTVASWWYNINSLGHWNTPHTHPDADIALVIYLTDTDSLLTFMNPFSQRKLDGSSAYSPITKKGDILIFPADINHYVRPNERDTDRVSISMNLQLC